MSTLDRRLSRAFDEDRFAGIQAVTDYRWLAPAVIAARERYAPAPHISSHKLVAPRRIEPRVRLRMRFGSVLLRLGNRLASPTPVDCANSAP